MPGNKKPGRKVSPKGIGSVQRMVERANAGMSERIKRKDKVRERNTRLAAMPMGHPANAYVLDLTFGPLYKMFDEHEKTGTHFFADDVAVLWVERDQCYTPIVEACFEMHRQFEFTAEELGWSDVPPGLMAYGAKLARSERISIEDSSDARETVAWMRDRLSDITCHQWAASMIKMESESK